MSKLNRIRTRFIAPLLVILPLTLLGGLLVALIGTSDIQATRTLVVSGALISLLVSLATLYFIRYINDLFGIGDGDEKHAPVPSDAADHLQGKVVNAAAIEMGRYNGGGIAAVDDLPHIAALCEKQAVRCIRDGRCRPGSVHKLAVVTAAG